MRRLDRYYNVLSELLALNRGLQRQRTYDKTPDLDTVQGIIEHGLSKILRKAEVPIHVSSRTDTGVHALTTTAQFDIIPGI